MVQGSMSKKSTSLRATKSKQKRPTGITKKGQKTIAPKRKALVAAEALKKRVTAQLTAGTERNLAERAGHLELLAGGKKDKKKKQDVGKKS